MNDDTPAPSYFASFAAGTVAGIAGLCVGHPFDTVKVRLQTPNLARSYTGTWSCFTKTVAHEGIRGLYKGMASPMVGVAIVNATVFGVYGCFMHLLLSNPNDTPSLMQIGLAGIGSGIVNSFIACPMELAKIRLQNQTQSTNTPIRGPTSFLLQTLKHEGIRGCYRGMTATTMRELSFGPYFVAYEVFCRSMSGEDSEPTSAQLILSGGLAGMTAWMSTYPFDSLKTHVQAQEGPEYRNMIALAREACRQTGGPRVLWRGLNATLLRAFPTNAVTFFVYEAVMRRLDTKDGTGEHHHHFEHGRKLPEGVELW